MDAARGSAAVVPEGQEIFNRVFIGGLARDTSELELENFFSNFGEVIDVRIVCDRKTGFNKGYGFVTFGDARARDSLVQKGTIEYKGGRKLRLRRAVKKETGGQFNTTTGTQNGAVVGNQIILVPSTESLYSNPICYQAPPVNYIQTAQQYTNCCYPTAPANYILYGYYY